MKTCKVEGCNGKHFSKGYCSKHYQQIRRYGEVQRTRFTPNEIVEHEDYAEIILYDKNCEETARALIDLDDIDKVKDYKWYLRKDYVSNKTNGFNLHRLVMDCPEDMVVDHINHNKLDNRKSNLRICTHQQNDINKSKTSKNTSGIVGVGWVKSRNKWRAYIGLNNKFINLGYFNTKEAAIQARKNAEIEYFGEYRNEDED